MYSKYKKKKTNKIVSRLLGCFPNLCNSETLVEAGCWKLVRRFSDVLVPVNVTWVQQLPAPLGVRKLYCRLAVKIKNYS